MIYLQIQNEVSEINQNYKIIVKNTELKEDNQNKIYELDKSKKIGPDKMNMYCNSNITFEKNQQTDNLSYSNKHYKSDINKVIQYFTLAANQNHKEAQFELGLIYYEGEYIEQDIKKGLELLTKSAENGNKEAYFVVGFLYYGGNGVDHDIEKAIHFYKEASSFNDNYAKNNLGIIYKNGHGEKITANIDLAIEYFEEAIKQKNDRLSMFNLANVYFYHKKSNDEFIKIFKLLKKSFNLGFTPSLNFLCFLLVTKFGLEYERIKKEIEKN